MRRFVLSLVLVLSSCLLYSQTTRFFGLDMGEKYTALEVLKAMQNYGFRKADADAIEDDGEGTNYFFAEMLYEGGHPDVQIHLDTDRHFSYIIFTYSRGPQYSSQKLLSLSESLQRRYSLDASKESIGNERCYEKQGSRQVIQLLERLGGGSVSDLALSFFDMNYIHKYKPAVQDMFFGLKLGSFAGRSTIIGAVGLEGVYADDNSDLTTRNYFFKYLTFGGHEWDYSRFQTTSSGRFMSFYTYEESDYYDNAWALYESFKNRLEFKYPGMETIRLENGYLSQYVGLNSVMVSISLRQVGSRYEVSLSYIHTVLDESLDHTTDKEL